MPTMSSYLFENIILNYFDSKDKISDWIDINLINFWNYLISAVYYNTPDPKGFQDNLNTLSNDEKNKISTKASESYDNGYEAYKIETDENDQKKAIKKWGEIFGNDFPDYE